MKKILMFVLLANALSACSASGGTENVMYGEISGGIEHSKTQSK